MYNMGFPLKRKKEKAQISHAFPSTPKKEFHPTLDSPTPYLWEMRKTLH
jgi:hypothetical protein